MKITMNNPTESQLEKFLFAPSGSHAKESIINNRLYFDLKLAAAERGYFLNLYLPEVDKDGFDIILDDQSSLKKIQLKTVMASAKTTSWNIHKSLLRPTENYCNQLGFEASPTGTGYQGGIILIEINTEHGLAVEYYYTDIIILLGIKENIINISSPPTRKALNKLFQNLSNGLSNEKTAVNKNMFLRAKSPSGLLALIGMLNTENTTIWRYHIQTMIQPHEEEILAAPRDKLMAHINQELNNITSGSINDSNEF